MITTTLKRRWFPFRWEWTITTNDLTLRGSHRDRTGAATEQAELLKPLL